ncbi:MAG: OmpH family outer membrane protein [Bacteroidetes bacterium]|nr:OmpH family outer membrane protein [Bacteroidota bacterium]
MIKNIGIIIFAALAAPLSAQKLGYVDSDLILNKMPEYKSAQKQLDDQAAEWQSKADQMQAEVDQLYKDYRAEEVLLTKEQKTAKEEAIVNKENELFKFREDKFGQTGELFKKREELIKPIQDKVFEAVQKVAKTEGLSFIFDKAGGVLMLYADPKYDKTFEVMEELGIPNDQNQNQNQR